MHRDGDHFFGRRPPEHPPNAIDVFVDDPPSVACLDHLLSYGLESTRAKIDGRGMTIEGLNEPHDHLGDDLGFPSPLPILDVIGIGVLAEGIGDFNDGEVAVVTPAQSATILDPFADDAVILKTAGLSTPRA
jgi:hypothetical protein